MSKTPLDLKGKKFNKLTVLYRDPEKHANNSIYWYCQCDCGKLIEKPIRAVDIAKGHTKSCGCAQKEWVLKYNTTHNLTYNRFYRNWASIKNRCTNPNCALWYRYGGRGITMYDQWINNPEIFIEFVSKLDGSNDKSLTIDRINNDGNYEPSNIRWLSREKQGQNRSICVIDMEIAREMRKLRKDGMSQKEIVKKFGVSKSIVKNVIANKTWKE